MNESGPIGHDQQNDEIRNLPYTDSAATAVISPITRRPVSTSSSSRSSSNKSSRNSSDLDDDGVGNEDRHERRRRRRRRRRDLVNKNTENDDENNQVGGYDIDEFNRHRHGSPPCTPPPSPPPSTSIKPTKTKPPARLSKYPSENNLSSWLENDDDVMIESAWHRKNLSDRFQKRRVGGVDSSGVGSSGGDTYFVNSQLVIQDGTTATANKTRSGSSQDDEEQTEERKELSVKEVIVTDDEAGFSTELVVVEQVKEEDSKIRYARNGALVGSTRSNESKKMGKKIKQKEMKKFRSETSLCVNTTNMTPAATTGTNEEETDEKQQNSGDDQNEKNLGSQTNELRIERFQMGLDGKKKVN